MIKKLKKINTMKCCHYTLKKFLYTLIFTYIPKEHIICRSADSLMSSWGIHVAFWKAALSHVKVRRSVPICKTK